MVNYFTEILSIQLGNSVCKQNSCYFEIITKNQGVAEKGSWELVGIYLASPNNLPYPENTIKSPRPLRAAFDRERFLITDKHREILDCIPCVMVLLMHSASRAQISTATCQTFDLDLQD